MRHIQLLGPVEQAIGVVGVEGGDLGVMGKRQNFPTSGSFKLTAYRSRIDACLECRPFPFRRLDDLPALAVADDPRLVDLLVSKPDVSGTRLPVWKFARSISAARAKLFPLLGGVVLVGELGRLAKDRAGVRQTVGGENSMLHGVLARIPSPASRLAMLRI